MNIIQLQTDCILQVPLYKYEKDFTFIVNSEKYETSSFVADLISPLISSFHLVDPTFNEFIIETEFSGDFNKIINLIDFEEETIENKDFPFIAETIEKLGIKKIDIKSKTEIITNDNVFNLIKIHQKYPQFFKKQLEREIEYFSSHFSELKEKFSELIETEKPDEFELDENIIELIISNSHLQLDTEDEFLEIINSFYLKDQKYSQFYEYVDFRNVEIESMKEFLKIFNFNHLTSQLWSKISARLEQRIIYKKVKSIEIKNQKNEFNGILSYFQTHSNIKDEVEITASSYGGGDILNLLDYENKVNSFFTKNEPNSWICFEFKNHKINPSNYIIRSYHSESENHLKTWIFEGSNDNVNWTTLDENRNNDFLKGANFVHAFPITKNNEKSFKFLRIRQTGPTWFNNDDSRHYLLMNSIEFYGKII